MKYIVYYRVSTEKQGDSGLGLEGQRATVERFLKEEQIAGEYTEVISGKIKPLNRPKLAEALEACEKYGYGLAVAKVDRLSRITEDALQVYSKLDGFLYSCDIPMTAGNPMDKFTLTIFMAIADRERELIGIRTKAALAAKKEKGAKLGKVENLTAAGRAKGVEAIKQKARQNVNNMRAMNYAKNLKTQGLTLNAIATRLNGEGFTTSRGKQFSATQVKRLVEMAA